VARAPFVELAHAHRFDHRRRDREPAPGAPDRHQRRRLGAGRTRRQVAADLAARRIRIGGAAAAPHEEGHSEQEALRSPGGGRAAAVLDPRLARPDVHRRELRARLERRAEGDGAHHADPHRHGPDGVCAQSRGLFAEVDRLRRGLGAGVGRACALRAGRSSQRSPGGDHALRADARDRTGHDPGAPTTRSSRASRRSGPATSATTCT